MNNFEMSLPSIGLVLLVMALSLHIIGIYILANQKLQRTFQPMILTHLSLLEIILLLTFAPYWVCLLLKNTKLKFMAIFETLNHTCAVIVSLVLIILTTDRLFACGAPLQYRIFITRKRLVYVLIITWSFGMALFFTSGLLQTYVLDALKHRLYENGLLLLSYFVFFLYSIFSYAYIYSKISTIRIKKSSSSGVVYEEKICSVVQLNSNTKNWPSLHSATNNALRQTHGVTTDIKPSNQVLFCKKSNRISSPFSFVHLFRFVTRTRQRNFVSEENISTYQDKYLRVRCAHRKLRLARVSFLIISSFVLFSFVPTCLAVVFTLMVGEEYNQGVYRSMLNLIWQFNFLLTPSIYIIGQKKSRAVFWKKIACKK